MRTRFDVKLDEESFNAARLKSKDWKLPITKTVRRMVNEHARLSVSHELQLLLSNIKDDAAREIVLSWTTNKNFTMSDVQEIIRSGVIVYNQKLKDRRG